MFEGHDTTASGTVALHISHCTATDPYVGICVGIAWALYNLARHPEHQEKCREEIDAIFSEKEEMDWYGTIHLHTNTSHCVLSVSRDDLRGLTYLKYCIKESLRLYPPVSSHGRQLAQDTEIDGHMFPAGTEVVIMPFSVHRCPDIWENPEVSVD